MNNSSNYSFNPDPGFSQVGNNQYPILKSTNRATFPSEEVYSVTETFIVDSRQRNCKKYKDPSKYRIELGDVYKNITSIELTGAIIPKSSYNVHSSNNMIDFAIGDFVSSIKIIDGGAGYTSAPGVSFSGPPGVGTTATGTAIVDTAGRVTNIIIGIAGSGYPPGEPPFIFIDAPPISGNSIQAFAVPEIGDHYTSTLREGEYTIGGNPVAGGTDPSGLIKEIQNSLNFAVNGGVYDSTSTTPFVVRVVSQYPKLGAVAGTPEASDTNATMFNRIQIVNVNSDPWEILWCSGPNKPEAANSILGFNVLDTGTPTTITAVVDGPNTVIPAGTAIRGVFDYNLKDDPNYVVLEIRAGDAPFERVNSLDDGLDRKFAALVFDANSPDTLRDLTAGAGGAVTEVGGVSYLEGPTGKGTFWREPGTIKALKGKDFDTKKVSFAPPLGKLSSLTVSFTKFGLKGGGVPQYYDFDSREHTLIFDVSASDNRSRQRD
jgi:hypothetical protein